jgi:hypothetical protein
LALNQTADFEGTSQQESEPSTRQELMPQPAQGPASGADQQTPEKGNIEMRVGYTINLNLPETTNPEVFNAIFKSLRDNLLTN